MVHRHTDEFSRDAVRIALTSGLSRKQVASDLGVGFSTLEKRTEQLRRSGIRISMDGKGRFLDKILLSDYGDP